jgi:DNA-binding MarR family transcriptional regulator
MSDQDSFVARVPGIQYGVLDSFTGYAVRRAQIRLYENFIRALEPWHITPPRYAALVIVSLNPGLKLSDLARIMGIARSGVVILVDALEERGYMQRLPAPEDRRAFNLALTEKGLTDLVAITAAVRQQDDLSTRTLTEDEQAELHRLLRKISEAP